MAEVFIECIDSSDKCSKFILFFVFDLAVPFSGDDIGKIFYNELNGAERETYPEPGDDQNKNDNQNIYKKHCPNGFQ